MSKAFTSLALLATLTGTAAAAPPTPKPFDGALAERLTHKQTGNYVVSPASIEVGLAMTGEGARGKTLAEFERVLGATAVAAAKALLQAFPAQTVSRPGDAPPELVIANRLFGEQSETFEPAFLDVTAKDYGARLEPLDFRTKWDDARQHINDWVARATNDHIKDLLSPAAIDRSTRLVLVDAVYMKAAWAEPFTATATAPAAFKVAGGSSVQAATMHGEALGQWGAHGGARMVDLPYQASGTGSLGMLIVVPDGASLASVEAAYARDGLAPFIAGLKDTGHVDVALPKFEVGTKLELAPALQAMGLATAFGGSADFTGISAHGKLQLSSVVHQAWIKVDEAGTEAAAATAVVMVVGAAAPQKPKAFAVDRSFLFFVHDDHGNVLFGGRVLDPTAPVAK